MDQIIILDGNVVGLVSDGGAARWEFESQDVEDRIAELCNKSI